MNLNDLYENISAQQRAVRQLPADFRPANTSPQLSGPYPGRNATRGYLVGEDSAEPPRKRHHFIYEQEPKLNPW